MSKINDLIKESIKTHSLRYNAVSYLIAKAGYGDINLAGQNARYKSFNHLRKRYSRYIGTEKFNPPLSSDDCSEKIWICWLQGAENAPEIVKTCIESVKYHTSGREIIFVDENNYSKYSKLPQYIIGKWEKGIISNTHFSDILRINILVLHGGLWLDATTYLTDSLPEYITDSDFFVYHDGFFDCEVINMGSWLIKSEPGNILLLETQNLLFKYWNDYNYLQNYFLLHLFFRMVSDKYHDEWLKVPYYTQNNCHIFQMEFNKTYNEKRFKQIQKISPIHKLTYKTDGIVIENDSYLSRLKELYKKAN